MICKFKGKALFTNEKQGVKKGEWVKGYLYVKEEKKRKRYFILRDIEIRLEPDFAWDYGVGPGEEDFYIHGMIEVIPETVSMQVGLIDKNNKEIYEGDVVKIDKVGMQVMRLNKDRWEIGWHLYGFKLIDRWNGGLYYTDLINEKWMEVIGNKWDNPELLQMQEEEEK